MESKIKEGRRNRDRNPGDSDRGPFFYHGCEVSAYDPDEGSFRRTIEIIRLRLANPIGNRRFR